MATGKRYRAAVIGGSGYGGAELIRRLLIHPDVELVRVASVDFVGEPLSAADPALEQVTELRFEGIPPAEAARGVDVVLLGLPHTVAAAKVPELAALPGLKIVDMSGDFRLKDVTAYQRWYKHTHPCPERLADFVYGLPELNRERLRAARFVASPGCFATTIELALLPLARAGLLSGLVHVQGITGSSGSGVAPSAGQNARRLMSLNTEDAMAMGILFAGNPDSVHRQIMEFHDKVGGFGHLSLVGRTGFMTHAESEKGIRLFSKEVLPRLREIKAIPAD